MKKSIWVTLLIIAILFILSLGAIIFRVIFVDFKAEDNRAIRYYSAQEITLDGKELTDRDVSDKLGVEKIEDAMSICLKKSGDGGISIMGTGRAGLWKEDDETQDVKIKLFDMEIDLEKKWDSYIYKEDREGKVLEIKLAKAEQKPEVFKEHPEYIMGVKYTPIQTVATSSFMLDGQYVKKGSRLYGKFFKDGKCLLGYCDLNMEDKPKVSQLNIIREGGQGKFLSFYKGKFYYLWAPADGGKEEICAVTIDEENSETTGESETLMEGNFDYLQVSDGRIYYGDSKYHFCSVKLDGKDQKTVIDEPVYMPYIFDSNWMIYQDDKDGERLHIATLDGRYDSAFTNMRSYAWTIKGRDIYFTATKDKEDESKHRCRIYKVSLNHIKNLQLEGIPQTEVGEKSIGDIIALSGEFIAGGDGKSVEIESWKNFGNDLYKDDSQEEYLLYMDDRIKITGKIEKDTSFRQLALTDIKTGESCSLMEW